MGDTEAPDNTRVVRRIKAPDEKRMNSKRYNH